MRLLRPVREDDIVKILEIYLPYVLKTAITFETEPPSLEAFKERVKRITRTYPWLVFEENGEILGYCYAGRFREREGYRWSAELSVYVHHEYCGQLIGTAMYTALLEILARLGYRQAYAVISVPNPGSQRLHDYFDFLECGRMEAAAFKLGMWRDIAVLRRPLLDADCPPEEPLHLTDLPHDELRNILDRAVNAN